MARFNGRSVEYQEKHIFCFKNNILSGITLRALLQLLWKHIHDITWRLYAPRVVILLVASAINSIIGLFEQFYFGTAVDAQPLNDDPIFVLGHPRTGTTHLHNMLAQDRASFYTPTTLDCGFPSGFLTIRPIKSLLSPLVSNKRPMDNVALSLDSPQEDELATNVLTGGISPYMPLVCMPRASDFEPFFSFRHSPSTARKAWIDAFLWFLRKVTFKNDPTNSRRICLKSPVHTARIRLLLDLFPRAQFVFIHRHPDDVFRSACHMADSTYWYSYLSTPSNDQITEFVLNQHEILYREYLSARSLVPSGSLHELSYEDLQRDGLGEMERLYSALGWKHQWAEARPIMRDYLSGLANYKRNAFEPLSPELKDIVRTRCKQTFDAFGYV